MRPVRLDIEKIATMQFRGRMGDRSIGRDSFCKANGVLFAFWAARLGDPRPTLASRLRRLSRRRDRVATGLDALWDDTSDDFGGSSHQPGDIAKTEE
jgi:hypothetical protein